MADGDGHGARSGSAAPPGRRPYAASEDLREGASKYAGMTGAQIERARARTRGTAPTAGGRALAADDRDEWTQMLRALTAQVSSCNEPLKPQEVGNALYGLQGMSSKSSEVRKMLRAISSLLVISMRWL